MDKRILRHICDLPQHPLELILAPQVKKPWPMVLRKLGNR